MKTDDSKIFDETLRDTDKPLHAPTIAANQSIDLLEGKRFFILRGFMKSGTNWACRVLNLHPEISCAGEFHWQKVAAAFNQNMDRSYLVNNKPGLRREMRDRLERMIKECIVLANHPNALWVGDRTPVHISPGMIRDVRIFNLIRDGRDVLISRAYHFFNNPDLFPVFSALPENERRLKAFQKNSHFFVDFPDELLACTEFVRESIDFWKKAIEVNFERTKEMDATDVMEVRYESLHSDIEGTREAMYRFLDVDPSLAGQLTFNTQPGFKKEAPDRFLRKGAVGDWKNYFSPSVEKLFMDLAGDTLESLGYV